MACFLGNQHAEFFSTSLRRTRHLVLQQHACAVARTRSFVANTFQHFTGSTHILNGATRIAKTRVSTNNVTRNKRTGLLRFFDSCKIGANPPVYFSHKLQHRLQQFSFTTPAQAGFLYCSILVSMGYVVARMVCPQPPLPLPGKYPAACALLWCVMLPFWSHLATESLHRVVLFLFGCLLLVFLCAARFTPVFTQNVDMARNCLSDALDPGFHNFTFRNVCRLNRKPVHSPRSAIVVRLAASEPITTCYWFIF